MNEENTPDQQAPSGQQENWKARYDGLVRKVEQLTMDNRSTLEQLATRTSEVEQLRAQLSLKEVEKTSAVGERDKQIQSFQAAQGLTQVELNDLRAMKIKLDVIKKLGNPGLMKVMDSIPAMQDAAAIETVFTNLAAFATDAANEREKQLKAGITPAFNSQQTVVSLPASDEEWAKHIDSLPLGSKERQAAHDKFWTWASSKYA